MSEIENEITENIEVEQQPTVYADKYRSPEDLERGYKEMQVVLDRQGQELAQLRQVASQVEDLRAAIEAPRYEQQRQSMEDSLMESWETGDPRQQMQVMAFLAQEAAKAVAPQQQQTQDPNMTAFAADQMLSAQYQDWHSVKGEVAALIQADPSLVQIDDYTPLDRVTHQLGRVYKLAKAEQILRGGSQAGQDAAAAAAASKQAAQTMAGSSSRPATSSPQQAAWDEIRNVKLNSFG